MESVSVIFLQNISICLQANIQISKISKIHSSTLILTRLWTSKRMLTKSLHNDVLRAQKPYILCSVTHFQGTLLPLQDLPISYVNASKSFSYMYQKDFASSHLKNYNFKPDWQIFLHNNRYIISFYLLFLFCTLSSNELSPQGIAYHLR